MSRPPSTFEIRQNAQVTDAELTTLLERVYVEGGHTPLEVGKVLFAATAVRARGSLLTAHACATDALLGTIIVVGPEAHAVQVATEREAELQLLAVLPEARGRGIGRALVEAGLAHARAQGMQRIVLSTQAQMQSAQAIYLACGFCRLPERDWNRMGRHFLVYGIES